MSEANEVGRPAEAEPTILSTESGSELRRTVREQHLHLPRELLERSVWRSAVQAAVPYLFLAFVVWLARTWPYTARVFVLV